MLRSSGCVCWLGALNFFTSSLNTLCNKTMDDTLLTIKQYEAARQVSSAVFVLDDNVC